MRNSNSGGQFRGSSLLRETVSNLLAAPVSSPSLAVDVALVSCVLVLLTSVEITAVMERQQTLVARGLSVFSVTAEQRQPFSGARCDELNGRDGVVAAGGIIGTTTRPPAYGPGVPITVAVVTPRLPLVIWPQDPSIAAARAIAGSTLADDTGLTPGSVWRSIDGTSIHIDATAAPSARDSHFNGEIVYVAAASNPVVECLVEADPGSRASIERLLLSWFSDSTRMYVAPFFIDSSVGPTPQQSLDERLSRFGPLAGFGVLLVVFLGAWFSRRADFALYRLMGVRLDQQARMMFLEFLMIGCAPLALGALVAAALWRDGLTGVVLDLAAIDYARLFALGLVIPLIGALSLRPMTSVESLKGR